MNAEKGETTATVKPTGRTLVPAAKGAGAIDEAFKQSMEEYVWRSFLFPLILGFALSGTAVTAGIYAFQTMAPLPTLPAVTSTETLALSPNPMPAMPPPCPETVDAPPAAQPVPGAAAAVVFNGPVPLSRPRTRHAVVSQVVV